MKALILFVIFALYLPQFKTPAQTSVPGSVEVWPASYLAAPMADINIENKPLREIVNYVENEASKSEAGRLGFRGIVLVNRKAENEVFTLHLSKVPLGEVLKYLANFANSVLVEANGTCFLYPPDAPEAKMVSEVFAPSKRVREALHLNAIHSNDVTTLFSAFGVILDETAEIKYIAEKNVLYAKLRPQELEVLRNLLRVVDRGVKVEPMTK